MAEPIRSPRQQPGEDASGRFPDVPLVQLRTRRCADDLIDTFVVEPDRHSAWGEEDSYAIAHDECSGVIHFEPSSSLKLHREYAERLEAFEALQNAREVVSRHTE